MIFYRSEVTPQRPISFDEAVSFHNVDLSKAYPILGIDDCRASGEFYILNKKLYGDVEVRCVLTLSDARTSLPIKRQLALKESFCLLSDPLEEEDGYVFPENRIDLTEVVFCLIKTNAPGYASDEKGPSKKKKEKEEPVSHSSPFDVLKDYDVDD